MTTPRRLHDISVTVIAITVVGVIALQFLNVAASFVDGPGMALDTVIEWVLMVAPTVLVIAVGVVLLRKRPPLTGRRCLVNSLIVLAVGALTMYASVAIVYTQEFGA